MITDSVGSRAHGAASGQAGSARSRARAEPVGPAERQHLLRGFAAELRAMRRGLGLTMAELARRARVSERWIRELEHGRARPSDGMCERLAAGLLPDCVRTVQAMTDLRFQRLAGASLHRWKRRRPRRESVARAYADAAAKLDEHEAWRREHAPTFLEALDAELAAAVERAGR